MASLSARRHEAGYATPLAMAVCLALTLSVGALAASSAADLRLARRDLDKQKAEYVLAGLQVNAAVRLTQSRGGPRLQWTGQDESGPFEVLAEAEAPKAGVTAAVDMTNAAFRALGVEDAEAARSRLRALEEAATASAVREVGGSRLWGLCGPTLVSPFGTAAEPSAPPAEAPASTNGGYSMRPGQVWRMRVSGGGWVDERIVRFTGHPRQPAATVERRFFRGEQVGSRCDTVFDAVARAG